MGKPHLTKEQRDELAFRYQAGEFSSDLAKCYNISASGVIGILRTRSVSRRISNKSKLTPEQKEEILKRYANGEGSTTLARIYGVKDASITQLVRRRGGYVRTVSEGTRRLKFNENAFAKITPESAYWIGFLMADGNTNRNRVSLRLATKDKNHIYKFKNFLKSEHAVAYTKPKPCFNGSISSGAYGIEINSKKLVSDLLFFGFTRKKSFTAKVAHLETNKDFWRGVIDGDGSVGSWKSRNTYRAGLSLCGSYDMMIQYKTFLRLHCPKCKAAIHKQKNIFVVIIGGQEAVAILKLLYEDAPVYLDRKYTKAMELIAKHSQ